MASARGEPALVLIDALAYCGAWPYWPVRDSRPPHLLRVLDQAEIQRAAICSTRGIFEDAGLGNEETLALAALAADRLIPFVTANPRDGLAAVRSLEGYARRGARGLRLYPQHHNYDPRDQPVLGDVLRESERIGWPVVISARVIMNWGLPLFDLHLAEPLFAHFPRVPFILSGLNYGPELDLALRLLRRYPNTLLETSCLQGFGAVHRLAGEVGADRLLLGTGLPLQYPLCGTSKVLNATLGDSERSLILGGNVRRLLRLGPGGA